MYSEPRFFDADPVLPGFSYRSFTPADFAAIADLIHVSTNAWYEANRGVSAFGGPPTDCEIFPRTYHALPGSNGFLVFDEENGRLAGSCFYHVRETHIGVGIVNVHPDYFGRRVARFMLELVRQQSIRTGLPLRLVSSAMNLDSFSLYSRLGFVARRAFIDMQMAVPPEGLVSPDELRVRESLLPWYSDEVTVREATLADAKSLAAFHREQTGIDRKPDIQHFLKNEDKIWGVTVGERDGRIDGYMVSCTHPAARFIGPGFAVNQKVAMALLFAELDRHRSHSPVLLIPVEAEKITQALYQAGARNIELHFLQVRGEWKPHSGLLFPTFLPETA